MGHLFERKGTCLEIKRELMRREMGTSYKGNGTLIKVKTARHKYRGPLSEMVSGTYTHVERAPI